MNFKTKLIFGAIALALGGCNNPVFDEEGDCDPHYYAKFVYDMNMEWADAFSSQVNSVELYVFDPQTGELVKKFEEFDMDVLKQPGYLMPLDLKPGNYEFIAWCGLHNNMEDLFYLPETKSQREHVHCRLERRYDVDGNPYQDKQLHHLFYGKINAELPDREGEHIYQVDLIKNTNNISLSLQHVSGLELTPDMFTVEMSEGNGHLNHDNSLMDDEDIQYRPWHIRAGGFDISGQKTSEDSENLNFFMAELSTSRLMKDRDPRINIIDNETGQTVYSIPIVKWATTFRSQQFIDKNNDMHVIYDDQEYLDRESTYNIMLYLDSKDEGGWRTSSIFINSWRVVTGDYEANY